MKELDNNQIEVITENLRASIEVETGCDDFFTIVVVVAEGNNGKASLNVFSEIEEANLVSSVLSDAVALTMPSEGGVN